MKNLMLPEDLENILHIWEGIYLSPNYQTYLREFRSSIPKFPTNGFISKTKFDNWKGHHFRKQETKNLFIKQRAIFAKRIRDSFSFIELRGFEKIVDMSLYLNKLPIALFKESKVRDCSLVIRIDENHTGLKPIEFNEGIFIRIGPFCNISSIKTLLDSQSKNIRDAQEVFRTRLGTKKKRVHPKKNLIRDEFVKLLWSHTKEELTLFFNVPMNSYKDLMVERIMQNFGYKISSENVRKIASRAKDSDKYLVT